VKDLIMIMMSVSDNFIKKIWHPPFCSDDYSYYLRKNQRFNVKKSYCSEQ